MQAHRRQSKCGRQHRSRDEDEVDPNLECGQFAEPCLKRNGEQEPGEDLGTGLRHPQLLQELVPIAIHAFVQRLIAAVGQVDVIGGIGGILAPVVGHLSSSLCSLRVLKPSGAITKQLSCCQRLWKLATPFDQIVPQLSANLMGEGLR